jgi:hypothetical protein
MGVGDKMTECDSQDKKDPHRPWLWLFVGFLLSAFLMNAGKFPELIRPIIAMLVGILAIVLGIAGLLGFSYYFGWAMTRIFKLERSWRGTDDRIVMGLLTLCGIAVISMFGYLIGQPILGRFGF